jgi:predicted GNAT family acetyltransferase
MKKGAEDQPESIAGQYSGPTLNVAGLPAPNISRTTKDWKPAFQGPPRVEEKTAVLSVDSSGHKTSKLSLQSKVEGDAVKLRLKGPQGVVASALLDPRQEGEGFTIERLEVPAEHRGQGHARTLLKEIKQWTSKPLFIRPRPFGDMPADIPALKKFYSDEGFVEIDGKDTMKLKTADWQPREVPPRERPVQSQSPALDAGRMIHFARSGNPKGVLASLVASKLLGGNTKLAATAIAAFGDELQKLRE